MGILRKVQGVTLRDEVHRFEIRKARNVKPLFRIRSVARKFSIGEFYCCSGGLYILKFDKNSTDL